MLRKQINSLRFDSVTNWGLEVSEPIIYRPKVLYFSRPSEYKVIPDFSPIMTFLEETKSEASPFQSDAKIEYSKTEVIAKIECDDFLTVDDVLDKFVKNRLPEQNIIEFLKKPEIKKLIISPFEFHYILRRLAPKIISDPKYFQLLKFLVLDDEDYHRGFVVIFTAADFKCLWLVPEWFLHPVFKQAFNKLITNNKILKIVANRMFSEFPESLAVRLFLGYFPEFMTLTIDEDPKTKEIAASLPQIPHGVIKIINMYAQGCDISFSRSLLLDLPTCLTINKFVTQGEFRSAIKEIELPIAEQSKVFITLENTFFPHCYHHLISRCDFQYVQSSVVMRFWRYGDEFKFFLNMLTKLDQRHAIKLHNGTVAEHNSSQNNLYLPQQIQEDADVGTLMGGQGNECYVLLKTAKGIQAGFELAFQFGFINPVLQPLIARYVAIIKVLQNDSLLEEQTYQERTRPLRTYISGMGLFKHHQLAAAELLRTLDQAPVKTEEVLELATENFLYRQKKDNNKIKQDGGFQKALNALVPRLRR